MKKPRHAKSAYKTKIKVDGQGNTLCRYCSAIVKGQRKTFCSDRCVHEWKVRTNPTYARRCVLARDKGFCCLCGMDTVALARQLLKLPPEIRAARRIELGIDKHRKTLWDMDHIVAVEKNGGSCGLENLRTLCWNCHKIRTAQQMRERNS